MRNIFDVVLFLVIPYPLHEICKASKPVKELEEQNYLIFGFIIASNNDVVDLLYQRKLGHEKILRWWVANVGCKLAVSLPSEPDYIIELREGVAGVC